MTAMADLFPQAVSILIVDDQDVERILIRQSLEDAGFNVEERTNGFEAVAAIQQLKPDIVFLDVFMPGMDGFATCAAIRNLPGGQSLPIIMVTGADDIDSIRHAYEVGATDFMAKPISWPLLAHRVRYIHRASQAFRDVAQSRSDLAEAQRVAQLGSWQWDLQTDRIRCSGETHRIFGFDDTSMPMSYELFFERIHPQDRERLRSIVDSVIDDGEGVDLDFRAQHPDGLIRVVTGTAQLIDDDERQSRFLRITLQDITERKRKEAELSHLAHHDSLTDLPNRVLLHDRLTHALARAARDYSMVAVHCLDLDRFKEVNDTLGHAIGDRLLRTIAGRLLTAVRGTDTVARIGGDEFTIIQVGFSRPEHTEILADRLVSCLSQPFCIDDKQIQIDVSIGVSLFPADAGNPDQLLKNADTAMYRAKAEGRNCFRFFVAEMDDAVRARKKLEGDLRLGLQEDRFEVHYQPLIRVDSGAIVGAEALLRMRHPDRDLLLPEEFIPISEETGLIVPIGSWTLHKACAQAARWHADGMPIRVSVNLSSVQFRQVGLVTTVRSALQEAKLAPEFLELEITETTLIHDTKNAVDVLHQLRKLGVHIAVDDFGTGVSSLNYLKLFPFNRIKIDRSLVNDLADSDDAKEIIKAIIGLGRSLGMEVTAEGIETLMQLNYLAYEGCDEMQGHYFSRPVPFDRFNDLFHGESMLVEAEGIATT